MKALYEWQGKPAKVRFGYVTQFENTEKPMYWYNFECNNSEQLDGSWRRNGVRDLMGRGIAAIPAVEVTVDDYRFLLSNLHGIGVHKLLNGGWPTYAHFSLDGKFVESQEEYFVFKSFDLERYEKHEAARRVWQKKNYPEEFKKMEALRMSIHSRSVSKLI